MIDISGLKYMRSNDIFYPFQHFVQSKSACVFLILDIFRAKIDHPFNLENAMNNKTDILYAINIVSTPFLNYIEFDKLSVIDEWTFTLRAELVFPINIRNFFRNIKFKPEYEKPKN
jgi:hypothetical protein